MILKEIDYSAPATLEDARAQWCESTGAFYLAGGTDLLPQMRMGRHELSKLVDLKRIPVLQQIKVLDDGGLGVGAAVVLSDIARHEKVVKDYKILSDCCLAVGSYPLRNRATMAGNICNGSPAADTAAGLLALDAQVVVEGSEGGRTVEITEFFKGPSKTALRPGEVVTEIVLPEESRGFKGWYHRLSRRKGVDLASVAVLVGRKRSGEHRVCLIAVAPVPKRVFEAEAVLDKSGYGEDAKRKAVEAALAGASPIDDVRATADYRKKMVGVLTARSIEALAGEDV